MRLRVNPPFFPSSSTRCRIPPPSSSPRKVRDRPPKCGPDVAWAQQDEKKGKCMGTLASDLPAGDVATASECAKAAAQGSDAINRGQSARQQRRGGLGLSVCLGALFISRRLVGGEIPGRDPQEVAPPHLPAYLLGLLAKIKCSICSYQLNF